MTILERMARAVEKVRERLLRASAALDEAGVPYAVIGGNAVAAWVARVDEAAVRNTQDVDLLLRRADLESARPVLERAGFLYRHSASLDMFLDGPGAKAREAIHVVFAGEKVKPDYPFPAAELDQAERFDQFWVLSLEALVRMKLTSYRDKDRTHLRDLIAVGLVDESWAQRLPDPLSDRLKQILADPDG